MLEILQIKPIPFFDSDFLLFLIIKSILNIQFLIFEFKSSGNKSILLFTLFH